MQSFKNVVGIDPGKYKVLRLKKKTNLRQTIQEWASKICGRLLKKFQVILFV